MRRSRVALIVAGLLCAQCATAQTRPELDGPSQSDMNRQASERYRMADEALNAVYDRLMRSSSPDGRERLRDAQRAWVMFRDLDCEARAGARGGSFHPAAVMLCRENVTNARTQTLRGELDCAEGDMGCGGHQQD